MDRRTVLGATVGLASAALAGCLGSPGAEVGRSGTPAETLGSPPTVGSPAFDDGDTIPTRFTCEGENVSPAVTVLGVPAEATALALLVDDPDAPGGTFTHWLLWGLPTSTSTIPEGVPKGPQVEALNGARQGTNDAGRVGYSGPCPPPEDGPHTYRFRLIALGGALDLEAGADRSAFDGALEGVSRSESVLRGTYER